MLNLKIVLRFLKKNQQLFKVATVCESIGHLKNKIPMKDFERYMYKILVDKILSKILAELNSVFQKVPFGIFALMYPNGF